MNTFALGMLVAATTTFASADILTHGVIFGSGNANGSFTTNVSNGIELGLRAKVRFDLSGQPSGVHNYDGVDTYTFSPDNGTPPAGHSMWSFDWSVNSDVAGSSGNNLNDFTYELALYKLNADGTNDSDALIFDPINGVYFDHSIGDNMTTSATDSVAGDPFAYANLISSNNVAQNSWRHGWLDTPTNALANWDPDALGSYIIRLTAFDNGIEAASTDITINVVPLPTSALAGLGLLGALGGIRIIRRR